jgi:hypothetical protein
VREGSATPQVVVEELGNSRPVAVRISWPNGLGHFVVLASIREDAGEWFVGVYDPAYPSSVQPWDVFTQRYLGKGQWTDTYMTQP